MKRIILIANTLLLAGAVFAFSQATAWTISPDYSIKFSSNDAGGIFKTFSGTILFDEQNLAGSKFDVSIDVASINTGNGLQNKHAKSDEWFDVAKYPSITFKADKFAKTAAGFTANGTLQIHGVQKSIALPFTFVRKGTGGLFTGSFSVNRNDYHIGKPGDEVGEVIKIDLSVPVTKK